MSRYFFDFKTELENLNVSIWRLKEYNPIFRIVEDINYDIIEKRKKDGWEIIDQDKLIEPRFQIKAMLWSVAKDIQEYNILLDLPILEVWEIILLNKITNYEGEPPNVNRE